MAETVVFTDKFGRKFRLTNERKSHILEHPEMKGQIKRIKETLLEPDFILKSKNDQATLLFYKFYTKTPVGQKHLLVACKVLNGQSFIITAFFTDNIQKGEDIWRRT